MFSVFKSHNIINILEMIIYYSKFYRICLKVKSSNTIAEWKSGLSN